MKHTITISRNIRSSALLGIMVQVIRILAFCAVYRVRKVCNLALSWLNEPHAFYSGDGDPIICTGKRFIWYNIIAAIVAFLLCLRY